jgi:prevent-host-death family protein
MQEVSTKDLKDQLSEWVRRVESQGERVVITRSGRPVAALVPLSDLPARDGNTILADLAAAGVIRLPRGPRSPDAFSGPRVPSRGGKLASEMIIEDRR